MKCLYYGSYNSLEVQDVPVPLVAGDEVLIKVSACGICGSEIETFKNKSPRRTPPLIMGHEFSGEIAEVGRDVSDFQTGQFVVSHSMVSCGHCFYCLRGDNHLCSKRQIFGMHRNGAFAEFVNVPSRAIISTDQKINALAACLSEPLANGIHIVNLTQHLNPKNIVIIGAGSIGLMVLQAFKVLTPCEVIIADLSDKRLSKAKLLGANHTVNVVKEDFKDQIRSFFTNGADLVVDAVGTSITHQQGLGALRSGGALVMIGLFEDTHSISSYEIILPEKQIVGTYAAKMSELKHALTLIETNQVDVTSWVTYNSIEHAKSAFLSMVHDPPAIKMIITSGSDGIG